MSGRLKKILLWSSLTLMSGVTGLFLHVLYITWPSDAHHAHQQLGRIDFPETLTPSQMTEAMQAIRSIQGVGISKFNRDTTSLVYSIPSHSLPLHAIATAFQEKVTFPCQPYIPDAKQKTGGCPVTGEKSILYRVSMYVHNAFS